MGDIASTIAATFALAGLASGVDPALLSSLCWVESRHKVNALRAQDGGSPSYGICQVKLSTARALGFSGSAARLRELETNAHYASLYLAEQHRRFGSWERAVSAYNAGRPIPRNGHYVRTVMRLWDRTKREQRLCRGVVL